MAFSTLFTLKLYLARFLVRLFLDGFCSEQKNLLLSVVVRSITFSTSSLSELKVDRNVSRTAAQRNLVCIKACTRKEAPLHSGVLMQVHACPEPALQLGVSHSPGRMSGAVMDDIIDHRNHELTDERKTHPTCVLKRWNNFESLTIQVFLIQSKDLFALQSWSSEQKARTRQMPVFFVIVSNNHLKRKTHVNFEFNQFTFQQVFFNNLSLPQKYEFITLYPLYPQFQMIMQNKKCIKKLDINTNLSPMCDTSI